MRLLMCARCRTAHRAGHCPRRPSKRAHPTYSSPAWRAARAAVAGHRCANPACRTPFDRVAAHHLVPREDGGPAAAWNLLPLCHGCHAAYELLERQGSVQHSLVVLVDRARARALAEVSHA